MRNLLLSAVLAGLLIPASALAQSAPAKSAVADVCVYGGTAAGVMAAVAARREGKSVIIVEPARTLGGMVGGGIRVNRDTRHPGEIGGLTRMMMELDMKIGGGRHENQPKFREAFDELVAKHGITVLFDHRLGLVTKTGTRIEQLLLDYAPVEPDGCPSAKAERAGAYQVNAEIFIDASYEGDLMALAGVPYAVGREASGERCRESIGNDSASVSSTSDSFLSGTAPVTAEANPPGGTNDPRITSGIRSQACTRDRGKTRSLSNVLKHRAASPAA